MNFCSNDGLLTDVRTSMPADPHEFWTGGPPTVPCTNLRCKRCKAVVRHIDKMRPAVADGDDAMEALYATADLSQSTLLDGTGSNIFFRTYLCRCEWKSVNGTIWLAASDQPWTCAGHPDEDGTSGPRIQRRAELFKAAAEAAPTAVDAWEALLKAEGKHGLVVYRQLMNLSESALVRGRAAITIGRLSGDYSDARSILAANRANGEDSAARAEAEQLLAEIAS